MKWFWYIIPLLLSCNPLSVKSQGKVAVEMCFQEDGTYIWSITDEELRLRIAQNIVRCRASHLGIECNEVLKEKWSGKVTQNNLTEVWNDIQTSSIFGSIQNDELEDVLITQRMSWWKEREKFIILRFIDFPQVKLDSIRSDSVSWKLPDGLTLLDSLGYSNITLKQINNNVNIPSKLKQWFLNKIHNAGYTWQQVQNVTLDELYELYPNQINRLWMRHPKIAEKLKEKWLKRQQ